LNFQEREIQIGWQARLDKILEKIPELLKIELANPAIPSAGTSNGSSFSGDKPSNLSTFLKEKNATSNQTKKFLATAAFLQMNGKPQLSTNDILKL
jgi:hypothetical protein